MAAAIGETLEARGKRRWELNRHGAAGWLARHRGHGMEKSRGRGRRKEAGVVAALADARDPRVHVVRVGERGVWCLCEKRREREATCLSLAAGWR